MDLLEKLAFLEFQITLQDLNRPEPVMVQRIYRSILIKCFGIPELSLTQPVISWVTADMQRDPDLYNRAENPLLLTRFVQSILNVYTNITDDSPQFGIGDLVDPKAKETKEYLNQLVLIARLKQASRVSYEKEEAGFQSQISKNAQLENQLTRKKEERQAALEELGRTSAETELRMDDAQQNLDRLKNSVSSKETELGSLNRKSSELNYDIIDDPEQLREESDTLPLNSTFDALMAGSGSSDKSRMSQSILMDMSASPLSSQDHTLAVFGRGSQSDESVAMEEATMIEEEEKRAMPEKSPIHPSLPSKELNESTSPRLDDTMAVFGLPKTHETGDDDVPMEMSMGGQQPSQNDPVSPTMNIFKRKGEEDTENDETINVFGSKDEFAFLLEGESEKQEKIQNALKDITKMWVNEEPYANVERPFPSMTGHENFCWYDLTKEWRKDRRPQPIPVDEVDWKFNYGRQGFVNLPFSEPQYHSSIGTSKRPRGRLITEALASFASGVRNLTHLEEGIRTYWKGYSAASLRKMLKGQSEEVRSEYMQLITKIAEIALRAKYLVTKALPMLIYQGSVKSVTMSQEQAACLLAYAFFCTVLPRGDDFNHFSFHQFHAKDAPIYIEKMKFILHYFQTVAEQMPLGTLTYSRQTWTTFIKDENLGYDKWEEPLSAFVATSEGLIEDMAGCLQVDFANEYIGGGVTNFGAVQEEIRFLCCPEMLVSLLLFDRMVSNEAILIQGAQQYSAYSGYSTSLTHVPMAVNRDESRDKFGRARSYLVAIDAVCYASRMQQFKQEFIAREIKKAYTGFMCVGENAPIRPIATGNWGCGVFGGDKELKSLIQLIAASKAGRAMIYITFKDEQFADELETIVELLKAANVKNGQLFELLVSYARKREFKEGVFTFIRRAMTSGV